MQKIFLYNVQAEGTCADNCVPGNGLSFWVAAQQGQTLSLQDLEALTGRGKLQGTVHAVDHLQKVNHEDDDQTGSEF